MLMRLSTPCSMPVATARAEKNWAVADAVRDGLTGLGFTIEDTPQGRSRQLRPLRGQVG